MKTNKKTEIDIAILYERVGGIREDIGEIKTNHLVHMSADIKELGTNLDILSKKIAFWAGGLAFLVFIVPILINVVLRIFFK